MIVQEFVQGCGLQHAELEHLHVRDFYQKEVPFVYERQWIHVNSLPYQGIIEHEVPFIEPYQWTIREVCKGYAPDDLVFLMLPDLPYEQFRDEYLSILFWGACGFTSLGIQLVVGSQIRPECAISMLMGSTETHYLCISHQVSPISLIQNAV